MRHEVVTNELEKFYDHPELYPPEVNNLLRDSFVDHCQDSSSQIEDWLSAYSMTFKVMQMSTRQIRPRNSAVKVGRAVQLSGGTAACSYKIDFVVFLLLLFLLDFFGEKRFIDLFRPEHCLADPRSGDVKAIFGCWQG